LRTQRFALGLPAFYLAVGDTEWRGGTTENISGSGVVIRADGTAVPDALVTVVVSLPSTSHECGACLVGRGRVTRIIRSCARTATPAFAVEVVRYRLHRRQPATDKTIH
jgi:hypothetical protein